MNRNEVPQDDDRLLDGIHEIQYAVDERGRYVQVPSVGWSPKNTALMEAHRIAAERVEAVRRRVLAGELSPLAYHMEQAKMDAAILGGYAGIGAWRVRRHLDPARFARLPERLLSRYARALDLTVEDLKRL